MHETHSPHFFHESALVHLDGHDFFADSADPDVHDGRVGQMLCGWAYDCGAREQLWIDTMHALAKGRRLGEPVTDYELSGWNHGGGI